MLLGLAIFLASGCSRMDRDGDGYSTLDGDCDDDSASISPGATESCDGADNDCDGAVDESVMSTFYADADGDGHGGSAVSVLACSAPAGFLEAATDCDDLDPASSPDGVEVCDGADNDCDGLTDEEDDDLDLSTRQTFYADGDGDGYGGDDDTILACAAPSGFSALSGDCDDADAGVHPGLVWYPDLDGDGYGDAAAALVSCMAPAGYLAEGLDCDDADPAISPDAAEVCDGGTDNDCDGLADDADPSVDAATYALWIPDGDGDGYGGSEAAVARCDAQAGYSTAAGDCDDTDDTIHPAAAEVCDNGVDDNCDDVAWPCGFSDDNAPSDAGLTLTGSASNLGYDLAVGDLNGDGYDDLVVPGYASATGTTWIAYGPTSSDHAFPADEDAALASTGTYDYAGKSVASGGDVDGDGYDDLLIGAYGDDDSGNLCGAAFLIYGGAPLSGTLSLDAAAAMTWYGSAAGDTMGTVVRMVGDLDDDGLSDVVLGGRGYSDRAGGVFVVYGSTSLSGIGSDADTDASLLGEEYGDEVGDDKTVAAADLDGDGFSDLLIGSSHSDEAAEDAGAAVLLYGSSARLSGTLAVADADVVLLGGAAYDYLGVAAAPGGDLDGDGYDDLLVGASGYDAAVHNEGITWVLPGQAAARSGEQPIEDIASAWLTGASASDYSGTGLSSAGDFDGDGSDDVLVGAPGADDGALSSVGAGYLVYGPLSGGVSLADADAVLLGGGDYVYTGQALTAADVNADGLVDVLISSYGADAVYVFFGGGL